MHGKKVIAVTAGAALLLGACKRETKDEKFKREFEQYTQKECPKNVNPYTCQDSICYDIESRTLTEYYTVWDMLDVDTFYTEDIVNSLHEDILKTLKSSIHMKPYKDEGINFVYDYRSRSTGKRLLELRYTKDDYGK